VLVIILEFHRQRESSAICSLVNNMGWVWRQQVNFINISECLLLCSCVHQVLHSIMPRGCNETNTTCNVNCTTEPTYLIFSY
jgi:hypothetical protein